MDICGTESGKKILITIDEVTKNDNIRVFSAAFQILLRKEYPVYLLMTGLYENIYNLQNEKSLTFLYRAPKVVLEPLNYTAMIAKYKQVFSCEQEKAEEMAKLTKGYSYAFQLLGYLMWKIKVWRTFFLNMTNILMNMCTTRFGASYQKQIN